MTALDQQSPEQHRQRYNALLAQARERSAQPAATACPPIQGALQREVIPGGWYWATAVPRGQTLRVTGAASTALLLWNAHDASERLNVADTVKVQWTVRMAAGLLLLSDMGRAMASITADSSGRHDMLAGGSTASSNAARYGAGPHRNTRDNFRLAAGKLGLDRRDIPPCLTLFADIRIDGSERLAWHGAAPGAIDLRMEMDVLVALSNCPHPLDPRLVYAPAPVEAVIWDAGPVPAGDPCRNAGPEAQRAFENNLRMAHG